MSDDLPTAPLPDGPESAARARRATLAPPRIPGYRLEARIGEGGFGEVWLAEQLVPVRRRVALKLIKAGMDTEQVLGRFESERQALARMDHPFIAKVYGAGVTGDRRPYFVMEYVSGPSITTYCDRRRLDTRERLELIVKVCQGVQHAHHKAMIHRDIKPSNLLVATVDGEPAPKIIDFGVAKAIGRNLTERSVHTRLGHLVGTPEYMSPEQAELTGEDIDTRTDVYSLGVVLYELLVGVLPVHVPGRREAGVEEIRRLLLEADPPRPSTRISRLGPDSHVTANNRRTEVPSLARLLRGDLDWIVMRALEKDRARRYASPDALAADIKRFLNDEPIEARPPSARYRVGKFVRRHRTAVAAAGLVLLSLVGGLAATTYGLVRARRAEETARHEAETSRRVSEFMVELFEAPAPDEARGNEVTAREILDRGVERIRHELADRPRTQAPLLETMGRVYRTMGLYKEAGPLLDDAIAIRTRAADDDPLALAGALTEAGTVRLWQGDYDAAEALGRRALALREEHLGSTHPDVAETLNLLGNALQNDGDLAAAAEFHRRAADVREATLGPDSVELAASLHNLAIVRYFQGDHDEAERLYRRSIAIEERHGEDDNHRLATSLHTLAILLADRGRDGEAIALEERSLRIRETVLGPEHPHTAFSLATLGEFRIAAGRPDLAEPLLRRAVTVASAAWDPVYHETRWMRRALAESLAEQGRPDEAEEVLLGLIADTERAAADDPEMEGALSPTLNVLAKLNAAAGRDLAAERLYRRSLSIDERLAGADHPYLVEALHGLANVLGERGRYDEATALFERALAILETADPPATDAPQALLDDYATLLARSGSPPRDADAQPGRGETP